ncbi:MAG TPA: HAMP domain-containing sensor histidine kinase [Rectinemataceae bacterium]|nr:HAMP domain-containing sensor histidine kinase [Rectinemataceae bacterium]
MHYCVADYVMDIAQNAVEAGARNVGIEYRETETAIEVEVRDDGRGMSEEARGRALDPFFTDGIKHPGRSVGLGLPFLVQGVEQAGGDWDLESGPGSGTRVSFSFPKGNADAPPEGDLPGLFRALLCLDGDHELVVHRRGGRRVGAQGYELRRSELEEALGGLGTAASLGLLREYIESQEEA